MTTPITKEQLIEKLKHRISVTEKYPDLEEAQLDAAIFKIALAAIGAEPIGAFHIADQQVSGTSDYIKDGEWPIDNGVIEVYATPPAPKVPDGWVMVPAEPTEDMIVEGFESEPDESFSTPDVWEAYDAMSGCQQAAHRAKLCWAAMIAAAPKQDKTV